MFAKYYDELMADLDYSLLLEPIIPYLKGKILDAGCGTGHILEHIQKHGYDAIGIDNDEQMLENANKKSLNSNSLFYFDLKNNLETKFDTILLLFDVVNYFQNHKRLFKNLYNNLNTDGILIIDFYKYEYLQIMNNYKEEESTPFPYLWQIKTAGKTLFHTFKTSDFSYVFKQYLYPEEYYLNILKKLGFKILKIKGNDERKNYIVCKK